MFYALTEGSFIMTKTLGDKTLLARHAAHLRNYLQLLFAPRRDSARPARGSSGTASSPADRLGQRRIAAGGRSSRATRAPPCATGTGAVNGTTLRSSLA
jgi:hypothetical protein